jgi:hypothetical protein
MHRKDKREKSMYMNIISSKHIGIDLESVTFQASSLVSSLSSLISVYVKKIPTSSTGKFETFYY